MALHDEVADALSKRTMALILKTGDEKIELRMAQELGAASPTLEEAFRTAMRIRKAEQRGLALLDKYERGEDIPEAKMSSQPQEMGH
jgi:hypothetical protein